MFNNQSQVSDGKEKPKAKTYTIQDLAKLDKLERYQYLGSKTIQSTIKSEPQYGFGSSDRNIFKKQYMSKAQCADFIGKDSPGPKYSVADTAIKNRYKQQGTKIGTAGRSTLSSVEIQQHYLRNDTNFHPGEADLSRKPKGAMATLGSEPRFVNDNQKKFKLSPGPQYDLPQLNTSPKFTLGQKRDIKGQSALLSLSSTPNVVGPGSYISRQPKTSTSIDAPQFSIPKRERFIQKKSIFKNESFAKIESLGNQPSSLKKSMPMYSIARSGRELSPSIFPSDMSSQPTKVKINVPKFL